MLRFRNTSCPLTHKAAAEIKIYGGSHEIHTCRRDKCGHVWVVAVAYFFSVFVLFHSRFNLRSLFLFFFFVSVQWPYCTYSRYICSAFVYLAVIYIVSFIFCTLPYHSSICFEFYCAVKMCQLLNSIVYASELHLILSSVGETMEIYEEK